MNENESAQSPVEQETNSKQMDESPGDQVREIELREQFLEKLMNELGADPKQRSLRVRAVIEQLSFDEDMTPGNAQDLDEEPLDSPSRRKQLLQWIENAIQNWKANVSNDSARTGLEDDVFEQLADYIYEYLRGKGKKRLFHSLLEVSKLSHPESVPVKKRCRQLIMNDAIMGFPLGRGTHKEVRLPLDSDRIDPSRLLLKKWKRALRRMFLGSIPRKRVRVRPGSS